MIYTSALGTCWNKYWYLQLFTDHIHIVHNYFLLPAIWIMRLIRGVPFICVSLHRLGYLQIIRQTSLVPPPLQISYLLHLTRSKSKLLWTLKKGLKMVQLLECLSRKLLFSSTGNIWQTEEKKLPKSWWQTYLVMKKEAVATVMDIKESHPWIRSDWKPFGKLCLCSCHARVMI